MSSGDKVKISLNQLQIWASEERVKKRFLEQNREKIGLEIKRQKRAAELKKLKEARKARDLPPVDKSKPLPRDQLRSWRKGKSTYYSDGTVKRSNGVVQVLKRRKFVVPLGV